MKRIINWLGNPSKTAQTIQTIIDNTKTSQDVDRFLLLLFKYNEYASDKNMDINFHKRIGKFSDHSLNFCLNIVNGLVNEVNRLKEIRAIKQEECNHSLYEKRCMPDSGVWCSNCDKKLTE